MFHVVALCLPFVNKVTILVLKASHDPAGRPQSGHFLNKIFVLRKRLPNMNFTGFLLSKLYFNNVNN